MTNLKKRLSAKVVLLTVLALLAGCFSFCKGAELLEGTDFYHETIETLDEKKANVAGMTVALVGASTLITCLPDDTGTPVAEQLMDLSDWLLLVLCVVFLEKYGLSLLWVGVFKALIPMACLLFIADLWSGKEKCRKTCVKLVLLSVVLAVSIPLGVSGAGMIENTYASSVTELAEEGDELAILMDAESEEKEGILNKIFGTAKDIMKNTAEEASQKLEDAKEMLTRYTEQVAVMLVTSCLVPIGVLLFMFWIGKMVLGLDISLPKGKTLHLMRKKR